MSASRGRCAASSQGTTCLIPDIEDFRPAYDWLRGQMRRGLPGYEGRYPWWAYTHKLDLRAYRFLWGPTGSRKVRLELAVPQQEVLLSGYMAWHFALNRWYLPQAVDEQEHERESDDWHAELDAQGIDDRVQPLPEPYQSRMRRSWELMFDEDELRETGTAQATFERLTLESVVAVTEFTTQAKRSPW